MTITTDQKDNIFVSGATAFRVNAGDSLIVERGVIISADSTNDAIILGGSNHVTLNGVVSGQYGIYEYSGGGSVVDISATGTVAGSFVGVYLGAGSTLNNHGSISGNHY